MKNFLIPDLPTGYKPLIDALFYMLENDIVDAVDPRILHKDVIIAAIRLLEANGFFVITKSEGEAIARMINDQV